MKCLRSRTDCDPVGQTESDCGCSFICMGINDPSTRIVEQDEYTLCWKNIFVDERSNYDTRDLVDTVAVIMTGLSVVENMKVNEEVGEDE